jgi:hypothetical protein
MPMPTLPTEYLTLIAVFVPLFSKRIWVWAEVLLTGAVVAPGKRTVTAILRVMGLSECRQFQTYHRVLNRAVWSSLQASRLLLKLLVTTFVAKGPLVVALDDTIERRRGAHIKAKGIYRDPVRSSHSHFVKASGLRWLSLMVLVNIPWARRVWALPFLTILAPSARYYEKKKRAHKKLTDWARQGLLQLRRRERWPQREIIAVADASFAVILLLDRLRQLPQPIWMVVRFRLDAALYEPVGPRKVGQLGRPRLKGKRLPTLAQVLKNHKTQWRRMRVGWWYGEVRRTIEITSGTAVWYHTGMPAVPIRWVVIRDPKGKFKSQALLCTKLAAKPEQIVEWFVKRWQVEVTFREVRTHLGVETQRQWSDRAIARTTPLLLGLFSLITVFAHHSTMRGKLSVRQAAWYKKTLPTFADALASVRQRLWSNFTFQIARATQDRAKVSTALLNRFTDALCYAAQ